MDCPEAADFVATAVVAIVVVAAKNDAADLHMVDLVAIASKAVDTEAAAVVVLEAAAVVVVVLEAVVVVADVHILEGVQGIPRLHVVLSFHDETLLGDVGIPDVGLL